MNREQMDLLLLQTRELESERRRAERVVSDLRLRITKIERLVLELRDRGIPSQASYLADLIPAEPDSALPTVRTSSLRRPT